MSAIHTTDQNFEQDVINSAVPVLVDFWAPWCGPCHVIAPVLEKISEEYEGRAKIVKLNVDENTATATKYGIMSIPNLKIFVKGGVVDEMVGAVPRALIEEKLKAAL